MGQKQELIVREFLDAWGDETHRPDVEKIVSRKDNPDYGPAGEARLRAFVEDATRGKVTRMERQVRWRPAWFVDVERDGRTLHLHLRGDRGGDIAIFPELKRGRRDCRAQ